MYSLSVIVGPVVWSFMFKTEEEARKAQLHIATTVEPSSSTLTADCPFAVTDDFGQSATIRPSSIHGFMLEDLDQTKLAHIERTLFNALVQTEGAKRAQSDPRFRAPTLATPMINPGIPFRG